MLGILIPYASFLEFRTYQMENIKRHVKCPHKVYILHAKPHRIPSTGHQNSLNALLDSSWEECDSFLFFDNDMIFLDDFEEPEEDCWYLPQERQGYTYAWPNLFYFKKHPLMRRVGYANGSDSGGSSWQYLLEISKKKEILRDEEGFPEFQEDYKNLCEEYKIRKWIDRFLIHKTYVFHFRAVSNWIHYPREFNEKKERLILHHVMVKQNS